jgi:hypothetical protein
MIRTRLVEDEVTPWLENLMPSLDNSRKRILNNMAEVLVDYVTEDVPLQSGYLVESGTEDWVVEESDFRASIKVRYTGEKNPPSNRMKYNQVGFFYPDKDYALFQHELMGERRRGGSGKFLEKNILVAEPHIMNAVAEGYWEVLKRK